MPHGSFLMSMHNHYVLTHISIVSIFANALYVQQHTIHMFWGLSFYRLHEAFLVGTCKPVFGIGFKRGPEADAKTKTP